MYIDSRSIRQGERMKRIATGFYQIGEWTINKMESGEWIAEKGRDCVLDPFKTLTEAKKVVCEIVRKI